MKKFRSFVQKIDLSKTLKCTGMALNHSNVGDMFIATVFSLSHCLWMIYSIFLCVSLWLLIGFGIWFTFHLKFHGWMINICYWRRKHIFKDKGILFVVNIVVPIIDTFIFYLELLLVFTSVVEECKCASMTFFRTY